MKDVQLSPLTTSDKQTTDVKLADSRVCHQNRVKGYPKVESSSPSAESLLQKNAHTVSASPENLSCHHEKQLESYSVENIAVENAVENIAVENMAVQNIEHQKDSCYFHKVDFDCVIIPSSTETGSLLEKLSMDQYQRSKQGEKAAEIHLIQRFDDLFNDNLCLRIHLDGNAAKSEAPGKLFQHDRPVMLVVSLPDMSPKDIASLNDLLDPENPAFNKNRLGPHVQILVLVEKDQLSASHSSALGPDTGRRLNRVGNTWDYRKKLAKLQGGRDSTCPFSALAQPVSSTAKSESKVNTVKTEPRPVNLYDDNTAWRPALFGHYGVQSGSGLGWESGALEQLCPGQTLLIKDAPKGDLAFDQALRNITLTGEIETNGRKFKLPEKFNIEFTRSSKEDRRKTLENLTFTSEPPTGPRITINSGNIDHWLGSTGLNDQGCICTSAPLEKAMNDHCSIVVTSKLKEQQWLQLSDRLEAFKKTTGSQTLITLIEKDQPDTLLSNDRVTTVSAQAMPRPDSIKIKKFTDQEPAVESLFKHHPDAEIVRINSETTLSQLIDNAHITSETTFRYGFRPSRFMAAMSVGRPVILCGLEQNPSLQFELETLFSQPACILINGHRKPLPGSPVYVLWPDNSKAESTLWGSAIRNSEFIKVPPPAFQKESRKESKTIKKGLLALQTAFKTIPGEFSSIKLPQLSDSLIASVLTEAREIMKREGKNRLLPIHYRKAVSRQVIHVTKEHKPVRDFMKVVIRQIWPEDGDLKHWVDIDKLSLLLGDGHLVDRKYIAKHFWQLAGAFSEHFFLAPELAPEPLNLNYQRPNHLETLVTLVANYAPEPIREQVKNRLAPDEKLSKSLPEVILRSSMIMEILNNAFYSGWSCRSVEGYPSQEYLAALSGKLLVLQKAEPLNELRRSTQALLQEHLMWQRGGSTPWESLIDQVVSGKVDQHSKQQRRLGRLQERIKRNKLITLEGATGTGKSYLAHQAAKALGPAFTLTVGPGADESQLLKHWAWQQDGNDRSMVEQAGVILNWARTRPEKPDEYATLVVDEANLAAHLLDNVLAGLWSQEPHIFCCSEKVEISPRHRVIFTCNPGAYSGRSSKTILQDRGVRVHYAPLNQNFLRDRVVIPALSKAFHGSDAKGLSPSAIHETADVIIDLQKQLKALLPERVFSPRDLTDVCAWMAWQLKYVHGTVHQPRLNAMVWRAFESTIAHSLSEKTKDTYQILSHWFRRHYGTDKLPVNKLNGSDNRLNGLYQQFCTFVKTEKPGFDSSSPSVKSLVMTLVQDLDRLDSEKKTGVIHTGRRATLIEGPAGRGKDVTLNLLLDMWLASETAKTKEAGDCRYFNVGDCDWSELKAAIRQAQKAGNILAISELNLIKSADLEGELNDVLTEPCAPGFHLFATTNPPDYSGRNALSPALKDRFRLIRIDNYTQQELCKIAAQKIPGADREHIADQLAALHCYVEQKLKQSGQLLFPVCRDIQNLAAATTPETDLVELFVAHYYLYWAVGNISKEELNTYLEGMELSNPQDTGSSVSQYDGELSDWLFATVPTLDGPLFIKKSQYGGYDVADTGEIFIAQHLSTRQAQEEIVRQVARWLWQKETNMPVRMGNDPETQALYIEQQRKWFNARLKIADIPASAVFNPDDKNALPRIPVSTPPLNAQSSLCDHREDLSRSELWERSLSDDRTVKTQQPKPLSTCLPYAKAACLPIGVVVGLPVAVACLPIAVACLPIAAACLPLYCLLTRSKKPKSVLLDDATDFDNVCTSGISKEYEQTFHSTSAPADIRMYRNEFWIPEVTDDGDIYLSTRKPEDNDLARVFPEPMSPPSNGRPIVLQRGEYGSHLINATSSKKRYPLPGYSIREALTKIRTVPEVDIQVSMDGYTGQHWVTFPKLKGKKKIRVHYILEPKEEAPGDDEKARVAQVHRLREIQLNGKSKRPSQTSMLANDACRDNIPGCFSHGQEAEPARRVSRTCPETIRCRVDELFKQVASASRSPLTPLTPNQQFVLAIINAENTPSLIEAAAKYCQQFKGDRKPAATDDKALFLLSNGVGSCRHRAVVFQFLLQYHGIPCRIVGSDVHLWCEVWNGTQWRTYDLGGSSGYDQILTSDFPEIQRQNDNHRDQSRKKKVDEDSLKALRKPVIEHFCKGTIEGFEQGCHLLASCKQYGYDEIIERENIEKALLITLNHMAVNGSGECRKALIAIEHAHDRLDATMTGRTNRQWEFLKELLNEHLTCIVEWDINNPGWCFTLAQYMIDKGWLDPVSKDRGELFKNLEQWRWLEKNLPELKPLVDKNITIWYQRWQSIMLSFAAPTDDVNQKIQPLDSENAITYPGSSPTLEKLLNASARVEEWTDQPRGAPAVERLLQGRPAFKKVAMGSAQTGKPIFLFNVGYLDRKQQTLEFLNSFARYLFTFSKNSGSRLLIGQAMESSILRGCQVKSPEDLTSQLLWYGFKHVCEDGDDKLKEKARQLNNDLQKKAKQLIESQRVKEMMGNEDLLVVEPEDLQKIYDEYYDSLKTQD